MYKLKRFLSLMQKFHVPLLLIWPTMLKLSDVINNMVWTRYKREYSYLYVNLAECLTFVGQMALFLWLAFIAKYLLRHLREFLAKKYPIFAEEGTVSSSPNKKGAVKQLTPRELINTVYYVLDAACILVFIYLCFSYIQLTLKSSSPISYAKYFTNLAMFPYASNHLFVALGLTIIPLGLLILSRKHRNSFFCLCQGVSLYGFCNLITVALEMLFKLDITTYALWGTLITTIFLILSMTYGVLCQLFRFGNMNFAALHPLLPYERGLLRRLRTQAAAPATASEPASAADTQTVTAEEGEPAKAEQGQPVSAEETPPAKTEAAQPEIHTVENAPVTVKAASDAATPPKAAAKPDATPAHKASKPAAARKKKTKRAKGGTRQTLEERMGLSFKSLWTIRFTLQMVPYLVLFVAFVLWLSTSLYTIQPSEQALVYRLGQLQENSVTSPGLHFKLPFPIDTVEIHNVKQMRNMYVGYAPADTYDYLWTSEHGGEEYTLLLGDGNELVAVNMRLNFTIDNLTDYITRYSDPESMLNSRAYAVMMERTVNSNLDAVLSIDRSNLSNDVKDQLNAYSDEQRLGIHVAEVIIENIHPPVEVAQVYQNVVNASIEQATLTSAAEAYASQTLSAAEQSKTTAIATATQDQTQKLAQVTSETAVFDAACEAYQKSPDSYTLWKLTDAYKQLISGTRLYVFTPETTDDMSSFLLMNGQSNVTIVN